MTNEYNFLIPSSYRSHTCQTSAFPLYPLSEYCPSINILYFTQEISSSWFLGYQHSFRIDRFTLYWWTNIKAVHYLFVEFQGAYERKLLKNYPIHLLVTSY